MAKSTEKQTSIFLLNPMYPHVDDVPWTKIETVTGKTFSKEERLEIHHCTERYSSGYSSVRNSPAKLDVDRLRTGLLKNLKEIEALLGEFLPPTDKPYSRVPIDKRTALDALSLSFEGAGIQLREQLGTLREASAVVRDRLDRDSRKPPSTSKSAEITGLEEFLEEVVHGATSTPSRNRPKHTDSKNVDLARWGILVGQKRGSLVAFTNAVLGTNFSKAQVREAHPHR